jgi:hypothetical protein
MASSALAVPFAPFPVNLAAPSAFFAVECGQQHLLARFGNGAGGGIEQRSHAAMCQATEQLQAAETVLVRSRLLRHALTQETPRPSECGDASEPPAR